MQETEGRKKRIDRYKRVIMDFLLRAAVLGGILYIMFGFIFGISAMNSNDMIPKIAAGDLMLYYRLEHHFRESDVVVYRAEGKQYTGRIVARGGDIVTVTEEKQLQINGNIISEPNIYYPTEQYENGISFPCTVPEGSYFILSDYRAGGRDSRNMGPIAKNKIKGKIMTIVRRSDL